MSGSPIDEVDKGILHLLQQDARDLTPGDMAERLPVSEGTVRNRISKMESNGIINGYAPVIDYEQAGYPLTVAFSCEAAISKRGKLAREALEVPGVITVEEMMTGSGNVRVNAVTTSTDDVTDIAVALTDLGLKVEREELMKTSHVRPFSQFGADVIDDPDA